MFQRLTLLRQLRGWHVFAVPVVLLLLCLVLWDAMAPEFFDRQDRIELLERNALATQKLLAQRADLEGDVERRTALIAEWRPVSFVSEGVDKSQVQFADWVRAQLAPLNLVSLNVEPVANSVDTAADGGFMQLRVTFDASPSQLARAEQSLVGAQRQIFFDGVAANASVGGASGVGGLRVTLHLRALHLASSLF